MNKFTNIVTGDKNLDEIHANYWKQSLVYFASQHVFNEKLSWMIGIWMKKHLESAIHCKLSFYHGESTPLSS
jgi:hypothetical protein